MVDPDATEAQTGLRLPLKKLQRYDRQVHQLHELAEEALALAQAYAGTESKSVDSVRRRLNRLNISVLTP